MTGMLASIQSLAEAEIVLTEQVDIIDLKNPANGALGRLDTDTIRKIITLIDGRRPVSATIGDLPMQPRLIVDAVSEIAGTKVDFIKIGLASDDRAFPVIEKLSELSKQYQLIAVYFADEGLDLIQLERLQQAGFKGVMLDTFDKTKGSLADSLSLADIAQFVTDVKSKGMLCGLAGSLTLANIPLLSALQPDYLGFRGALCVSHTRTDGLESAAVRSVKNALRENSS